MRKVVAAQKTFLEGVREIFLSMKESHSNLYLLLSSSFIINVLSMAMPLVMLQAYDRIIPNVGKGTLASLMTGMGLIVLFEFLLRVSRSYLTSWAGSVFEHRKSTSAVDHIVNSNIDDFELNGSFSFYKKIGQISKLRSFHSGQALMTIVDLPFTLVFLVTIFYISGNLVLVPMLFISIVFYYSIWIGRKIRKEMIEKETSDEDRLSLVLETFSDVDTLKSYGLENQFITRFNKTQVLNDEVNFNMANLNAMATNSGFVFNQLLTVSILTFGAIKIINGEIGIGALAATTILSSRVMQPIQRSLGLWTRIQGFFVATKKLEDVFSLKRDSVDEDVQIAKLGTVDIKNLSLSYHNRIMAKNINLTLGPGDSVCITSHNHQLVKTFVDSLLGLSEVKEGELLVDDTSPYQANNRFVLEHICYLGQSGEVFKGSIWENISLFGQANSEDVEDISKKLGVDSYVSNLPKGYKTELTNTNVDAISPGIRQLLSLTRSLSMKGRVVIFDNADMGLDKKEYNLLYKYLGRIKDHISLIVISDDQNIQSLCDRKLELNQEGFLEKTLTKNSLNNDILKKIGRAS